MQDQQETVQLCVKPYTYQLRPPVILCNYPGQRYYGSHLGSVLGLQCNDDDSSRVTVFRRALANSAELQVRVGCGKQNSFECKLHFNVDQLRELAARLLDAAQDIEMEQKGSAA